MDVETGDGALAGGAGVGGIMTGKFQKGVGKVAGGGRMIVFVIHGSGDADTGVIADEFRQPARGGVDNRKAAGHGFHDESGAGVGILGVQEDMGAPEQGHGIGLGVTPEE